MPLLFWRVVVLSAAIFEDAVLDPELNSRAHRLDELIGQLGFHGKLHDNQDHAVNSMSCPGRLGRVAGLLSGRQKRLRCGSFVPSVPDQLSSMGD